MLKGAELMKQFQSKSPRELLKFFVKFTTWSSDQLGHQCALTVYALVDYFRNFYIILETDRKNYRVYILSTWYKCPVSVRTRMDVSLAMGRPLDIPVFTVLDSNIQGVKTKIWALL